MARGRRPEEQEKILCEFCDGRDTMAASSCLPASSAGYKHRVSHLPALNDELSYLEYVIKTCAKKSKLRFFFDGTLIDDQPLHRTRFTIKIRTRST